MPSLQRLAWVFTINNYTEENIAAIETLDCRGMVCGKEVGESGTPHLQGVVCFHKKCTRKHVVEELGGGAWVSIMRGSWNQATNYAKKDGDLVRDFGEGPHQGRRTDIEDVKRKFDEGASVEDLCKEAPGVMRGAMQMFRFLEDRRDSKKIREEVMPRCLWLFGDTGVGKTHCVNEYAKTLDEKPYWKYKDNMWWDNYTGQKVVIINEFRGGLAYEELLAMADKFYYEVSRRGRAPMPFLATTILVTSRANITSIFPKENVENGCAEMKRRFTEIEKKKDDGFDIQKWLDN